MFEAVAASERIFAMLEQEPGIVDGELSLDEPVQSIEFDDVSLSYDGAPALSEVSLRVDRGETVVLSEDLEQCFQARGFSRHGGAIIHDFCLYDFLCMIDYHE